MRLKDSSEIPTAAGAVGTSSGIRIYFKGIGDTSLATERVDWRLAAVPAVDVAGYDRLMGRR